MYDLCQWIMPFLGETARQDAPWNQNFSSGRLPWANLVQDPRVDWVVPGATSDWVKSPGRTKQRTPWDQEGGLVEMDSVDEMDASVAETLPSDSPQRESPVRRSSRRESLPSQFVISPEQMPLPTQLFIPQEETEQEAVGEQVERATAARGRRTVDEALARQRRGSSRLFPKATEQAVSQSVGGGSAAAVWQAPERSWPDLTKEKYKKRICSENYSAVEIHGFYGLIDDGSDGAGRMLIVHVPKWVRGYFLDIRQGDTLHVYHVNGKTGGQLYVLATGRHRYYKPGSKVSTCTVCVPEDQWARFA